MRRLLSDRLGVRLVVISLLVSTALSAIATGIQLYFSYQRQSAAAIEVAEFVSESMVEPLQNALWEFDFQQVQIILQGIQSKPAIAHVQLNSTTGHTFEFGDRDASETVIHYELSNRDNGQTVIIGSLNTALTLAAVRQDIWAQLWTLIASNLMKAYAAALALLFIFYRLVTRHLDEIAQAIRQSDGSSQTLTVTLDRSNSTNPDALDQIVKSYNAASASRASLISNLRDEVEMRKRAEQAAQASARARKEFLANMSHEVRTPLNAMMGLFQIVEMSDVDATMKSHAATGLAAGRKMERQLNNVLDVSRIEADAVTLNRKKTPLEPLVVEWRDTTIGAVSRLGKDIKVCSEIRTDVPAMVYLDRERTTQIVMNLCDNAAKFTHEGNIRILVETDPMERPRGSHLKITVADTGSGIPKEKLEHVFERFAQVDTSLTRRHSGTGLGLSISSDLARMMGGDLSVESPSRSGGYETEFVLSIPMEPRPGKEE